MQKMMACVAILLLLPSFAWGMERFDIVTTEQMRVMLAQREAGEKDFFLINTLDELMFQFQAIPGSINVPWSRFEETKDRLGDDKNRLLVFYCKGFR